VPLQSVTQTTPPRATLPYGVRALPLLRCQSETDGVKREREHRTCAPRAARTVDPRGHPRRFPGVAEAEDAAGTTLLLALVQAEGHTFTIAFVLAWSPKRTTAFGDDAVAPGGWVRRRAGRSRLSVAGAQAPAIAWPLLSDTGSCTVAYGSPSAGALALRERM